MDDNFPPKNRKSQRLGILEIKITSKDGTIKTDPNGKAIMGFTGDYPIGEPVPDLKSEISGKPAYRIELDDIELALSFEEMDRFFRLDLTSGEYKFLLNKYGMFHEIHEDFYWEDEAYQPIPIAKKTLKRIKSKGELTVQKKEAIISQEAISKASKKLKK